MRIGSQSELGAVGRARRDGDVTRRDGSHLSGRPLESSGDSMTKRVFVNTGDESYYAGTLQARDEVARGIGYVVLNELESRRDEGEIEIGVEVIDMSDEEVAELPEI